MSERFTDGLETHHLDEYDDTFFDIQIMTIDEVARFLKVCDKTIRRLINRNEIPVARIGKSYRFYRSDIVRWLHAGGTNENKKYA